MKNVITYVGIDSHKKDLFMAMLVGTQATPVTWSTSNEPRAVGRLVKKREREAPGMVRVFYEAGQCGYALQRQVMTSRVSCDVVAPALIPRKLSERVKTNRRDAHRLAELVRAGLLTALQPPTPEDEAVRDLARARDDAPRGSAAVPPYLGLVPGEDSSGENHRRGRITRTGNALARWLLIGTAWHYQQRPTIGVAVTRRRTGQPGRVIAISDKAQQRLCRRFRKLAAEHKPARRSPSRLPGSSRDFYGPRFSRWRSR